MSAPDVMDDARKLVFGLPALARNLRREGQTSRADVVELACKTIKALADQALSQPARPTGDSD